MHSLDVIMLKNARAAGREAAHAVGDGDLDLANRIFRADYEDLVGNNRPAAVWQARVEGFLAGMAETIQPEED